MSIAETHWSSGKGKDKSALAEILNHGPFCFHGLFTQHKFEESVDNMDDDIVALEKKH